MIKLFPFLLLLIASSIFINGMTCKRNPEHGDKNLLIRERRHAAHIHHQLFGGFNTVRGAAKLEEKLEGDAGLPRFEHQRHHVSLF